MIEYQEWSIKNKDGIGKFLELKGKVLPTSASSGTWSLKASSLNMRS